MMCTRPLSWRLAALAALAAIGLAEGGASAGIVRAQSPRAPGGVIRGRVEVQASAASDRRPTVSEIGRAHQHDPQADARDRRTAVVYLERAPRGAFGEADERRVRIDQRGERFVPHVVAITVGSVVDFPNSDRTYHNVFSLSDARTFDLGRYAAGHSKSVRFERPGIVRVFCDIHSHMSAFVLVFAHRFFDVTDAEGRYRIPSVPPGTYTLTFWNELTPPESRQVAVPEDGEVEANFVGARLRAQGPGGS
jgi:plastocyanin